MGIRSTIPARFRCQLYSVGFGNPLLDTDFITVQPGLAANYGIFAIIKIRVVDNVPISQKIQTCFCFLASQR